MGTYNLTITAATYEYTGSNVTLTHSASFESTRSQLTQQHFEVLEIDLPVITGTCTLGGVDGFGTPITCDEAWTNEYKTYKFTNENAPLLSEPVIYRSITHITENTTQLKPASGLSERGSLTITFADFIGDPNEGAAGVTSTVRNQGTFFGKLNARQIIENKTVRLKLYRLKPDGTVNLSSSAETHYYITESLKANSNGTWQLACKDVLSLANLDEKTWPPTAGGYLRQDITNAQTVIKVDLVTDYSSAFAVRIGDEFMEVVSVSDNMGSDTELTVVTRGTSINAPTSGAFLTRTTATDHEAGDEVFICELSDDETIDALLTRILIASDFDSALIPASDWAAEVAEWHATDKINTLHSEAEDVNDILTRILTGFMMNLWFDQIDNQVKLSAISVWKETDAVLTEGKEIDAYSLKSTAQDSIRASRALILHGKRNLADNDDTSSYSKASFTEAPEVVSAALYKEHKDKMFDPNTLIDADAGDLLVQRYVAQFKYTPYVYKWQTQERFLNFKAGHVVDLNSVSLQSASGLPSSNLRAQVTKVQPKYTQYGREYDCTAMAYAAAFNNNSEIVKNTPLFNGFNFYIEAGAPSQATTVTFILDGSYSYGSLAMRAGAFPSGSKLILILVNGFDAQANGGAGGVGEGLFYEGETSTWVSDGGPTAGSAGGIVFDANGVDTDIYLNGATPSTSYPTADGYLRAPAGGGGGGSAIGAGTNDATGYGGHGGGGGAGRLVGNGGHGGEAISLGLKTDVDGTTGSAGTITGTGGAGGTGTPTAGGDGGAWGVAGSASSGGAAGGAAGKGLILDGATLNVYTDGATTRFIQGAGDAPTSLT